MFGVILLKCTVEASVKLEKFSDLIFYVQDKVGVRVLVRIESLSRAYIVSGGIVRVTALVERM